MDSEIGVPGKGNAEITRRAPNGALKMGVGNCFDVCVLEWCKLFVDKKGEHFWGNIVSDAARFEAEVLLGLSTDAPTLKKIHN